VRDVHVTWGFVAVVANALAGLYALAAWRWPRLRGRPVWAAIGVAFGAIMVQVVFGVWLVAVDDFEPPEIHMFYGFLVYVTVGVLYSYNHLFRARGWMELAYGLGGLFMMGLGIRAIFQV